MILFAGCGGTNAAGTVRNKDLQILFINVGKADSALVTFDGRYYLVDTGSAASLPQLVKALRSQGVKTLEGVFLSHTHEDHAGGLSALLKLFEVKQVYAAEITENKDDGNTVDTIAQEAGKTVKRLKANDKAVLSAAYPHVKFEVAGPVERNLDDDNDNSLVLYLTDGDFSCLFAGDMQFAEENTLLKAGKLHPCTVLKIGNHGNPDASSQDFLQKAAPEYAVISTDSAVDTDTPSPEVLERLTGLKANVFVTQEAKTGILLKVHGGKAAAEKYAAPEQPSPAKDVVIASLDKQGELLVLKNNGSAEADLSKGWLYSERGGEMFVFPAGTKIKPGGTLSIASGKDPQPADLTWDEKNVWHGKKAETAAVFDALGNVICREEF